MGRNPIKKSGIDISTKSHAIEKSRDFREIAKNPKNEKKRPKMKNFEKMNEKCPYCLKIPKTLTFTTTPCFNRCANAGQ